MPADGGMGDEQLVGGCRKAAMALGRFEGPKRIERGKAPVHSRNLCEFMLHVE
jgi:hypothetical protein